MTAGGALVVAEAEDDQMRWIGSPRVTGPPWMKNFLVTSGFLGLTSVWTIEMSQASPRLIELGLSKSYMSLVFVAGPLSGLIMQPLIGIMADRCESSWGRRRPFIVAGIILTVVAMLLLGWCQELASLILGEGDHKTLPIIIAVFSVFLVDFAVNAIQAADRALLVDTLPPEEQETGNAWAGRLSSFGSVAGFWTGNVNLQKALPFFGKTQLQALSVLTTIILISTHALTLFTTHERVLLSSPHPPPSFLSNFRSIISTTRSLPPDIRTLCFVQFFAWVAWFPVLFFTSVWVSDLYTANAMEMARLAGAEVEQGLYDEATRAGSRALLYNALIAFVTSVLLPFAVEAESDRETGSRKEEGWRRFVSLPIKGLSLPLVWCVSLGMFSFLMMSTWFVGSVWAANLIIGLTGFCWAIANWAPFSIIGELILQDSPSSLDTVPLQTRHHSSSRSDLTAPREDQHESESHFLLESEEDRLEDEQEREGKDKDKKGRKSSMDADRDTDDSSDMSYSSVIIVNHSPAPGPLSTSHLPVPSSSPPPASSSHQQPLIRTLSPRSSSPTPSNASLESLSPPIPRGGSSDTAAQAGAILGIHNLFIVLPQFLITFLSSILFYLLEPSKSIAEHGTVSHPGVVHSPAPPFSPNNDTISSSIGESSLGNGTIGGNEGGLEEAIGEGLSSLGGGLGDPFGLGLGEEMLMRRAAPEIGGGAEITGGKTDAVGFIFRFGGVSAAVACFLAWRMMRGMEAKRR